MTTAGVAHEVSRALDCRARSDSRGFDFQGVSIPRVLKKLRNDGSPIALQTARPLRGGSDVQVKYPKLCPYFVLNTFALK